jgi:hypothetical protein
VKTRQTPVQLPDLCAYCGENKPDPALNVRVSGGDQSSRATLTGRVEFSTTIHDLDVPLCPTCYAKREKEKKEVAGLNILGLILIVGGALGLLFSFLRGFPTPWPAIFAIALAGGIALAVAIDALYKIHFGGYSHGGWWFKEPKYEREFARLNPDLLTPARKARLMRIGNQSK